MQFTTFLPPKNHVLTTKSHQVLPENHKTPPKNHSKKFNGLPSIEPPISPAIPPSKSAPAPPSDRTARDDKQSP
jgi:hypothetical protein